MPRGRPKGSKNKSTLLKAESITTPSETEPKVEEMLEAEVEEDTSMDGVLENPPPTEKKNTSPKVKKNNVPVCSRCGKEIKTTPYRLNLTYLTGGIASWHRYTADDKPILCKECATDLSNVIDKWLLKGGAETKFPVPEKVTEDTKEEVNKEEDFDF